MQQQGMTAQLKIMFAWLSIHRNCISLEFKALASPKLQKLQPGTNACSFYFSFTKMFNETLLPTCCV